MIYVKSELLLNGDSEPDLHAIRRRRHSQTGDSFRTVDTFEGVASDPITLHKYLYGNDDPVNNIDPSGNMSLAGTIVTAGIKAGLMGLLIGAPFRGYKAAMDIYAGASLRDVATEFLIGAATDFALGAVLGGGAAGLIRQFGSNAFRIRAVGQSLGQFISARVPWSAWRLAASARGLAIEKTILNRAAVFLGRQINNFPVIDDYIVRGGRGIASSIKSIDLTLPSYANPAAVVSKLSGYADDLSRFASNGPRSYSGFTVGNAANPVNDRVLIVAIEEGAATAAHANALIQWVRQAPQQFPNIRVLILPIP